jgi:hypothetical protein
MERDRRRVESDDVDRIRPASRARLRVGELIRSRFRAGRGSSTAVTWQAGTRDPIDASSARSSPGIAIPVSASPTAQVDARPRGLVVTMSLHMSTIAIPLRAHCGETARDRARARRALPRRTPHQLPTRPAVVETLPGGRTIAGEWSVTMSIGSDLQATRRRADTKQIPRYGRGSSTAVTLTDRGLRCSLESRSQCEQRSSPGIAIPVSASPTATRSKLTLDREGLWPRCRCT